LFDSWIAARPGGNRTTYDGFAIFIYMGNNALGATPTDAPTGTY
jgi:hypothetical protein